MNDKSTAKQEKAAKAMLREVAKQEQFIGQGGEDCPICAPQEKTGVSSFGDPPKNRAKHPGLNARQIHLAAYHEGHTCIAILLLRLLNDGLLKVADDLDNARLADARDILAACSDLEQAMAPDWLRFSHDDYIGAVSKLLDAFRAYEWGK